MGALEDDRGGSCELWPDHLVGRAPDCALRLDDNSVSWRHASLRWTGRGWELQDLGSLNGTFLNGQRVEVGARVLLRVGARLRFGEETREWLMADADPPEAAAVALDDGTRIKPHDGLIVLPSGDEPELSIYRQADGNWIAEGADRVWALEPDEIVLAGTRRFRFEPGAAVYATSASMHHLPTPAAVALEFVVSRNEEQVDLTIVHGGKRTGLRPRAHTYLLLTLARLRMQDQAQAELPQSSHGWIEQSRLLKMLATTPAQLALDIYRARRQFSDAGVVDSAQLVERRASSRELRLGVESITVQTA
jgi:pSer/pThr/pTyr-binding forkhead associated (FHA) protein